jgi:hypothetical protein
MTLIDVINQELDRMHHLLTLTQGSDAWDPCMDRLEALQDLLGELARCRAVA